MQRVNCPCCGYPTIELHGDYSLTEARHNFREIPTDRALEIKRALIRTFVK